MSCQRCGEAFQSRDRKAKYCSRECYHKRERKGRTCRLCPRPHAAKDLCSVHYYRRRKGMENWDAPFKPKTGAGWLRSNGYVLVYRPQHPNANSTGALHEHIVVMTEALGRALEPHETVHHRNGQRADNRLENLELWSTSQPRGQRVEDKVAWAQEILALYGRTFACS